MARPLRLMFYDATCTSELVAGLRWVGLTHSWQVGGQLYGALGRLDAWQGFASWSSALAWLASYRSEQPIAEIQYWGHGKWGAAFIAEDRLTIDSLDPAHPDHDALRAIRERMRSHDGAPPLWWFRTCETFGADSGHAFARAWTEFFDCRAAGHTYVIGPWQSGLHSLLPGQRPHWNAAEGLCEGTPADPRRALWSTRSEPNTISCLHGQIPAGY